MRVALVHDYLNQRGGAERVFSHIARAYPDAPIYTSLLDPAAVGDLLDVARVRPSFLQHLPGFRHQFRLLAPLFPLAFERFNLEEYDLIVSSTTAWAKGVRFRPDATHICYINTVSRFAFSYDSYVGGLVNQSGPRVTKLLQHALRPLMDRLIAWDYQAAQRPTAFIANSHNVAARVQAYYGRASHVLPCPVDVNSFYVGSGSGGYALVVSRFMPYKRIDLAIRGCASAKMPLMIVGSGPAQADLMACAAGTRTHFLGNVDDRTRADLMAEAEIVILPAEEDFGLVPVEAAAAGRPALAYGKGGALETIIEHETGEFFNELNSDALASSLQRMRGRNYDPQRLRAHAETFAPERFTARLRALVTEIKDRKQPGIS